jgi:hypothetical protein
MNLTLLKWGDNPYRVLGPETPQQYAVQAPYANGINRVSWSGNIPSDPSPAVSYEVEACLNPTSSVDACTSNLVGWNSFGFSYNPSGFSGGGYDAGFQNGSVHTLTMARPFTVDASTDSLRFKITYSIEASYDYGYVDVSTDGGTQWATVQGNITTTANPNGANRGHGFTGSSGGVWVNAIFPLTPYLGQEIQLRFSYVTDGALLGTGYIIDNINPLVTCASVSTIASALADTLYDHIPPVTGSWNYRVRAKDSDNQWSDWSHTRSRLVTTLTASDAPRRYQTDMGANYPNPFNPSTRLPFVVGGPVGSSPVPVELAVFSVTGARVATLIKESRAPGTYVSHWDGRDDSGSPASSGVYFARVVVGGSSPIVRKLVLLK